MINKNKHIKILFVDFWDGFDYESSYFYKLLAKNYIIEISNSPDILFYSFFGVSYKEYNCTKVYYTGENARPDFSQCDFALSFDYSEDSRNYRLPLYVIYDDVNKLIDIKLEPKKVLESKSKFCCFIVSNPGCEVRNNFFKKLNERKHVDSAGRLYNNTGKNLENKREFIKDYKFVIAFENWSYPGYVTEKIFEPFLEDCVPIYWGTELVHKDFNTKRFINCHDFKDFDAVIDHVIAVDNDDEAYMNYLKQPVFVNDELNEFVDEKNVLNFLDKIIQYAQKPSFKRIYTQTSRYTYFITRRKLGIIKRKIKSIFLKSA